MKTTRDLFILCLCVMFMLLSVSGFSNAQSVFHPEHLRIVKDTTQEILLEYALSPNEKRPNNPEVCYLSLPFDARFSIRLISYAYDRTSPPGKSEEVTQREGLTDGLPADGGVGVREFFWRDLRLLRLEFNPTSSFPSGDNEQAIVFSKARFKISMEGEANGDSAVGGPFEALYQNFVFNYESSKSRRGRPEPQEAFGELPLYQKQPNGEPALKFSLAGSGLRRLSFPRLKERGLDVDDVSKVRLWRNGTEVPCFVREISEVTGPALFFYAPGSGNPYSGEVVYWLSSNGGSGAAMPAKQPREVSSAYLYETTFTARILLVEQKVFPKEPRYGPQRWFWKSLPLYYGAGETIDLDLPGLAESSPPVKFTLKMFPSCTEACTAEWKIGSATAQMIHLEPGKETIASATVEVKDLREFQNKVYVRVFKPVKAVDDKQNVYLESLEIQYDRLFALKEGLLSAELPKTATPTVRRCVLKDVSPENRMEAFEVKDATNIILMPNAIGREGEKAFLDLDGNVGRVLAVDLAKIPEVTDFSKDAPSNLRDPNNQCDYLIVSHRDFIPSIQELKDYRESKGLRVLLVDVQDVYDEFSNGNPSVEAIRSFFHYTLARWKKPLPSYALLVGDSNWDPWDRRGLAIPDYLPSYMRERTPFSPSEENWFVRVGDDMGFDHIFLGRLAVKTPADLKAIFAKIKAMETQPELGWWKTTTLLAADDLFEEDLKTGVEKISSSGAVCESLRQSDYSYLRSMRLKMAGTKVKFCCEATGKLLGRIDDGCLFFIYMGHGGASVMGVERLFLAGERGDSDVLKLDNAPRYPFFFSMSCLTGLFTFDDPPPGVCIAEDWLRRPEKGGVAAFCPTGKGSTIDHLVLAEGLGQAAFDLRMPQYGQIVNYAKFFFWHKTRQSRLINEFAYFGDPALLSVWPAGIVDVSPQVVLRNFGDQQQQQSISGQVAVASLQNASAEVRLLDEDGKILWSEGPFQLDNGRFSVDVPLGALPEVEGRFCCYAWNAESGEDAFGSIAFRFVRPTFTIYSMTFSADEQTQRLHVEAKVKNGTKVPFDAPVQVRWRKGREQFESRIDSLLAGETRTVSAEFSAGSGIHRVEVELDPDSKIANLKRTNLKTDSEFLWQGPDLAGTTQLAILTEDIKYGFSTNPNPSKAPLDSSPEFVVKVWNYGGRDSQPLTLVMTDTERGNVLGSKDGFQVSAGEHKIVRVPFVGPSPNQVKADLYISDSTPEATVTPEAVSEP